MTERIWFGGIRESYAVFWLLAFIAYWLVAWLFARWIIRNPGCGSLRRN